MKNHRQIMKPMKLNAGKNWLWLWILPAALSWLLVSLTQPAGGAAFWAELGIICSCSCLSSFALAFRSFSTLKERLWGGLLFAGGSLCVIASVAFIGCAIFDPASRAYPPGPPSKAELERQQKNRIAEENHRSLVEEENQRKAMIARLIVPRDAQADATMLDLTSRYDMLVSSESPGARPVSPPGSHTWQGIKFDVRGAVRANNVPGMGIPLIRVGQRCSGIAVLLGEYGGFLNGSNFSRTLTVHFANGRAQDIPLVFGKDLASSLVDLNPPQINLATTNSVVWEETTSSNGASRPYFVLYIKKWDNPFPDVTVGTISFLPPPDGADSFLVAITVLPVNP